MTVLSTFARSSRADRTGATNPLTALMREARSCRLTLTAWWLVAVIGTAAGCVVHWAQLTFPWSGRAWQRLVPG